MKYVITDKQYNLISEMIKVNIKVGDTIMGGKFKNKKVIVKDIGKNEKGDITINGKPLLRFRIIKESSHETELYKVKALDRVIETLYPNLVSEFFEKYNTTRISSGEPKNKILFLFNWSDGVFEFSYDLIDDCQPFLQFDELDYGESAYAIFKKYANYAFGFNPKRVQFHFMK